MKNNYVDFRAVKSTVSMRMILDHYGVNWLRKRRDEMHGRCPIHKGEGTETFHANLSKNAFQCFSCKARGNVLDFVAAMEHCTVKDAALKLAEWFSIPGGAPSAHAKISVLAPRSESGGEAATVNVPLAFQLKDVDPSHSYLAERGITKEVAEEFGIGFYSGKGKTMAGRVVIPIHNERGELLAYAGRAIDSSEPKYKLPVGFHKSLVLFNLHRSVIRNEARVSTAVIVEGFFDCTKVHAAGYPSVALMGCSLSAEQEQLLCSHFTGVVLMLDGDEAGRRAATDIASRLARKVWVRILELPDGKQPDMLSAEELQQLLK